MQHEITKKHPLLNEKGYLIEAGYSKKTLLNFNKENLGVSKYRLKQWDYYLIGNSDVAISLTLAHNGYMAVCGMQIFDFKLKKKYDYSKFIFRHKNQIKMPNQSLTEHIEYKDKQISLKFNYTNDYIHLIGHSDMFKGQDNLEVDVKLFLTNKDYISIATPFHKHKKYFYFNEKMNHLRAEGYLKKGKNIHVLNQMFGVLDWGRGVWPYDNTWYWSSASGLTNDNKLIGFNLGYGFGDLSHASENMVYYDRLGYKFDDIIFDIPKDFMNPWHLYNQSKTIDLTFDPIYDNQTKVNYILLGQDAHQVFGIFKGFVIINHKKIEIINLFGFAEKVRNRW